LVVDRGHDDFIVAAIGLGADPNKTVVRVENDLPPDEPIALAPSAFAELVAMEINGELTSTQAKQVLAGMLTGGGTAKDIADAKGFKVMDVGALESVVDGIIAAYPNDWSDFVAAEDKARKKLAGFFTGHIMKATQGKADGRTVAELLAARARG